MYEPYRMFVSTICLRSAGVHFNFVIAFAVLYIYVLRSHSQFTHIATPIQMRADFLPGIAVWNIYGVYDLYIAIASRIFAETISMAVGKQRKLYVTAFKINENGICVRWKYFFSL